MPDTLPARTTRRAIPAPIAALPGPSLAGIERAILAAEDAARADRALNAAVFAALGWEIGDRHLVGRSPWSARWIGLPHVSGETDAARLLVPLRWDWGVSVRGGAASAWTRDPARPEARYTEANGPTPALALLRAALHAIRLCLIEARGPVLPRHWCDCGWAGPQDALRAGGTCPDCHRQVTEATDA